jgi:hypothetical protein
LSGLPTAAQAGVPVVGLVAQQVLGAQACAVAEPMWPMPSTQIASNSVASFVVNFFGDIVFLPGRESSVLEEASALY